MDKAMLLMMLAQQAPKLLQAIKGNGGLESVPNIVNAIESGMDTGLMEDRLAPLASRFAGHPALSGLDVLDGDYITPDITQAFPSDGEGNGLSNLFADLSTKERQMIDGPEAALSAATFLNNPVQELPGPESPFILGNDSMHQGDEDFLHSNEIWDSGLAYKAPWNKLIKKKT